MEYKVVIVEGKKFGMHNFQEASEKLIEEVNAHMAEGWQLQGGICSTIGPGGGSAYLSQALTR